MSRSWRFLSAILCVAIIVAAGLYAMFGMAPPSPELDLARSKKTDKGLYVATVKPAGEPIEIGVMQPWTLTLATPDGKPVAGAAITIDGGMPDHNHGLPTSPKMTADLGDGRYTIDGLKFTMNGWWVLRFNISAAAGSDDVVFNLRL